MEKTTLTKEEFIKRSMAGEVFIYGGDKYFYDTCENPPFRLDGDYIRSNWGYFDGKTIFEIEEPKPIIERRWRWRKDEYGRTQTSDYVSDKYAEIHSYIFSNWYKVEDDYIDVETKQ